MRYNKEFYNAVLHRNIEVIKKYISTGKLTENHYSRALISILDTTFHQIEPNDIEICKMLINAGADVNYEISIGVTPLNRAIQGLNIEIIRLLIESGANDLNSALNRISSDQRINSTAYFIEKGIINSDKSYIDALIQKNLDIIKLLIDSGASNLNDALLNVSQTGHIEIVKYLIDKGANNLNDALVKASYYGHIEIVKYLIGKGATSFNNALIKSVNQPDVLKYLLDNSANPNISKKNTIYRSALGVERYKDMSLIELAVSNNQLESVRHIIASSQNILGLDNALYIAVEQENIDIARVLIQAGADVNNPSVLWASCIYGKTANMFKLLIESGANIKENISIVYAAYSYLPKSQEKELDDIFTKAGFSSDKINSIKDYTHECIPSALRKKKANSQEQKTTTSNSKPLQNINLQTEILQQQQKYIQSIVDIIETKKSLEINKLLSPYMTEQHRVPQVVSIFDVLPTDILEKDIPELNEFVLKLMLIVKNYFGDSDRWYKQYEEQCEVWFKNHPNSLVWFRRCQTLDKTLISNPDEPIKYPPIPSGKVLTKKLTPPEQNIPNKQ